MPINEHRRVSFGERAEQYDEVRPRYAPELFEAIADYAGLSKSSRVLEIGCGTGIATLPMARRGCAIDAIDPSEGMTAVALRKLAPFPRVSVRTERFEDADLSANDYDLAFSAQAWHWLDPDTRSDRIADALRPGAALAIFGHAVLTHFEEAQDVYCRLVPEWFADTKAEPLPPIEARLERVLETIAPSARFTDFETRRFPWTGTYTAAEFVRLVATYSDHATVPEPRRSQMFDALAQVIDDLGGRVERANETLLVLARVAPAG